MKDEIIWIYILFDLIVHIVQYCSTKVFLNSGKWSISFSNITPTASLSCLKAWRASCSWQQQVNLNWPNNTRRQLKSCSLAVFFPDEFATKQHKWNTVGAEEMPQASNNILQTWGQHVCLVKNWTKILSSFLFFNSFQWVWNRNLPTEIMTHRYYHDSMIVLV